MIDEFVSGETEKKGLLTIKFAAILTAIGSGLWSLGRSELDILRYTDGLSAAVNGCI